MYDVVVIGGGPGGYAAAIRASQLGARVALAEADEIGGTCVNRGCIPSKSWLYAADLLHRIRNAAAFGIDASVNGIRLKVLREQTAGVAGDIRMGMEGLLGNNQVKQIRGRAEIRNPRTVSVDGNLLETKVIIVATGSRAQVPAVPGLEEAAITPNQVFELETVPESVFIWGAGPIEVEMATLLNRFGAKVTLAMETPRVLPREDGDTGQRIGQALRAAGVDIIGRCRLESVKPMETGCRCFLTGPETRELEVEMVLTGARIPNTTHMGLEAIGVQTKADGGIEVDEHLQTAVSGVFAVGDATGGWMLSHAASAMGIAAAENAMGKRSRFPFDRIPRGVWTSPQVGAAGLTEEEAEAQGYEVETGDFPYSINGLAMVRSQLAGAVKIISDARYGRILGVHVVGAGATELIGEAVLAMELESTVGEFAKSLRVHPTFSETLVEAARDAAHWALYLPKR